MNDINQKALNKKKAPKAKKTKKTKKTKKVKQKLLTPEQRALQAKQEAKQKQLKEITAHSIKLFQQYTALRKNGLDSPTATLQAYADYEKVHGDKLLNSMWTKIKSKTEIKIYDRERQDNRKSLNLAKIPTRLEAKRRVLTQNQKKVYNQNTSTLRFIGGKKLPVTSMELVVCPVCEIYIKNDAIEWHLRHNHVGHVDNPFTKPVVAPVDTVEGIDNRVNRSTGERYISFWADKPESTERYLLQVYSNAIRVTLPFMGLELNQKCVTKWFDTLEEAVEIRDLLIGDKILPIESPTIDVEIDKKDKSYFNKQVYQTALRTMTQSEAWKLATDEEANIVSLSDQYINPLIPPEPNIETSIVIETEAIVINEELTKPLEAANDTCATGRTVEVTHKARHTGDQADFKRRIWNNFNGRCAITGYPLPEGILEAAHIEAITEAANNNTSNGLLLEVSLHRMFDKGLLGINPDDLTVHFAIDCIHKTMFEGKTLQPHHVDLDDNKLMVKWKEFNDKS